MESQRTNTRCITNPVLRAQLAFELNCIRSIILRHRQSEQGGKRNMSSEILSSYWQAEHLRCTFARLQERMDFQARIDKWAAHEIKRRKAHDRHEEKMRSLFGPTYQPSIYIPEPRPWR